MSPKAVFQDVEIERGIFIAEMLKQLSERDRTILKLKIVDDYTFPQITTAMGIDVSTVKAAYYRALKKLRSLIE